MRVSAALARVARNRRPCNRYSRTDRTNPTTLDPVNQHATPNTTNDNTATNMRTPS